MSFQRAAGLPGLAASLFLAGCACGGLGPVTSGPRSFTMPALVPGPTPEGATISRTGFEGGGFSATLPVRVQETPPSPAEVLAELEPVLRAAGFQRNLADLAQPDQPIRLEPPDLKGLSVEVCREASLQESRSSRALCDALSGGGPLSVPSVPSTTADEAIRNAYGLGYAEWKSGMERLSFQYPFSQVVKGVPIEGTGVSAFRRDGESVSLVQGSLFNRYTVVNKADPERLEALLKIAFSLLATRLPGDRALPVPVLPVRIGEPELVLIPDGTTRKDGETVPALRYSWRVLVGLSGRRESWMIWVDAARGSLLKVASQWKDAADTVAAEGVRWRRDPGLCRTGSCTEVVQFEVDKPSGDKLVLALKGVFRQVENNGDPGVEVKPGPSGFNVFPINDDTLAVCAAQNNSPFRQVNAYSHLYSLWKIVGSVGIVPTFPEKPLRVVVDDEDPGDGNGSAAFYDANAGGQDALSSLWLSDGQGFREAACPEAVGSRLNGAQDVTVLAHETSHLLVQRLQERRPAKWCVCSLCNACPMPDVLGHNILHDFADGLAFSYASTDCFAGWTAKNLDDVDAHLACKGKTSEAGGFPRRAELPVDRFPDHRGYSQGEYANGQIAAAALWEVRKGLRSKSLVAGTEEYWVRLLRSLWGFGFLTSTCSFQDVYPGTSRARYNSCDRDVFLYLQDLERRMVGEWVMAGPPGAQTVGKVLSGWAKAGLYLIPYNCLDDNPATTDPAACPGHVSGLETAPDAVIEIDDRDEGDDPVFDGVVHPEVDYLRRSGPPPRFRIWAGPRYRFSPAGVAATNQPPCGVRYELEVAADPKFQTKRWSSGSTAVPSGACEAEVDLPQSAWQVLRTGGTGTVYYRARTWDILGRERISTEPGAGAFKIDVPFAVINDSGKP